MITTNPLDGLLEIRNDNPTARWNFTDALNTPLTNPGGIGNPVTLTYSFLDAPPDYSTDSQSGFLVFNDIQKQATRAVLTSVSQMVKIKFVEVDTGGLMSFAMDDQSGKSSGSAYPPSFRYSYLTDTQIINEINSLPQAGDVWLNSSISWTAENFFTYGFGYGTLLHELGHTLGLKHPFEGNYQLNPDQDNHLYTVMSYNYHPNSLFRTVTDNGGGNYLFNYTNIKPETLMPFDIAALQYLYGANMNYNRTDTVYRFNPERPFIKTIWDTGGIDTISITNFTRGSTIKLQAGAFSSINIPSDPLPPGFIEPNTGIYNGTNNLAIAEKTIIENALGGAGNDRLIGNQVANYLSGNSGNDTLDGNQGNDTLEGGRGTDQLIGGPGKDIFLFTNYSGADKISDFSPRDDTIQLKGFSGLKTGTLAENQFVFGNQPLNADEVILYDTHTGILSYDPDGNGSGAAVKIAVLGTNLAMSYADLVII